MAKSGKKDAPGDVLAAAIAKHRDGHLDEACAVYRQILSKEPENPDALHYLGLACYQNGEPETAVGYIRDALQLAPEYVEAYNNLGTICQALDQLDEAEHCYRKVIGLRPDHADSHNNLGVVLKSQGRPGDAADCYRKALSLDANHAQAHHNLGNLLRRDDQSAEAISHFRSAIDAAGLEKTHAHQALVNTLRHGGYLVAAREALADWLAIEPDHPIALHIKASIDDGPVPARASDAYVRMMFDRMANTFDEHLDGLDYRAHILVIEALKRELGSDSGGLTVLDAGCGTGLCGPLVRSVSSRLVGIDLSSKMLQKAQMTDVYDELIEVELTGYLKANPAEFDVIICADTLCYFGDLAEAAQAAAAALLPGGRLVFTVELLDDDDDTPYFLNLHGRYSHARNYVHEVITRCGLQIDQISSETLRKETGSDVKGLLVSCRRPGGDER